MLLDASLLLYAVHKRAAQHDAAVEWLTRQLNGSRRVGIPWQSLGAFLRIATRPRAFRTPLAPTTAWQRVSDWLAASVVWTPEPGPKHAQMLGPLIQKYNTHGNLVPDAQLAALAIEYGLEVCSADTDFARFSEVPWTNPAGPTASPRRRSRPSPCIQASCSSASSSTSASALVTPAG